MTFNSPLEDSELGVGIELRASRTNESSASFQSETTAYQPPTLLPSYSSRDSLDETAFTQEELDDKPWKYIGYRGYSEFLASESDWLVFRRFGVESARIALGLQNRVSSFSHQLSSLDKKYSRRDTQDVHNGSFRSDQDDRKKVFDALHQSILDYNIFMLQQAQLKKFPSPSERDVENIRVWHRNTNHYAIEDDEKSYLDQKQDLFSLVPREKTPLRKLLDRSLFFRRLFLFHKSETPELPLYNKSWVHYFSDELMDRCVTVVIVSVGTVMLVAPMWILQALGSQLQKLWVITAFLLSFVVMISYATVARPFEILAATAAYAAVLTVFLQFGGSLGSIQSP